MQTGIEKPKTTEIAFDAGFKVPSGMIDLSEPSQLLLEQMKAVKQSPTQIPAALAMGQIASRLIDIAKTQVQQGNLVMDMIKFKNSNKE